MWRCWCGQKLIPFPSDWYEYHLRFYPILSCYRWGGGWIDDLQGSLGAFYASDDSSRMSRQVLAWASHCLSIYNHMQNRKTLPHCSSYCIFLRDSRLTLSFLWPLLFLLRSLVSGHARLKKRRKDEKAAVRVVHMDGFSKVRRTPFSQTSYFKLDFKCGENTVGQWKDEDVIPFPKWRMTEWCDDLSEREAEDREFDMH